MKKNNRRSNWILYLAGILFCLTLFSMHLTSGLYARYSATVSGEDGARVARFSIQQSGELSQVMVMDVYPGFNKDYTIKLKNESEVAVNYTVSVERLTNNLPLTITWTDASGSFAANSEDEVTHTLKVSWPATENDEALSYEVDALRVIVHAEQID